MIISFSAEKPLDKIQEPFMIKSFGEISDTRNIPKHNKANIQQAKIYHQIVDRT